MNVKNVEKENGAAKVTIEIARDEFQTALDKAYAKIRKDIMIPGFRKGKAPRKFVERMYGSQVFYEDAVNEIFPEIYEAAIVKQELKAVGQPSVTDMQTPEDGSVVLTVSTELYPEVTLGEYKRHRGPQGDRFHLQGRSRRRARPHAGPQRPHRDR
ncbi:MAG: trigger factor family protein [Oscillospiraceae bacterium]